jgi:hypothetical protein
LLPKRFRSLEDLFRPRANPIILREVEPAHSALGIHQELSGSGNVLTIDSGASMNEVVTANRFSFRIRKKSKGVSGFLTKVAVQFRTVYADSKGSNSCLMKPIQTLFNAP